MHQNVQQHRREKKHTKQCKVETKCKNCFQKCADFASIHSFHLHCLSCKGGLYQCPFCDDEIFTRITIKNVNIILNNVGGGNV